jgi:hypothetical protein
LLTAFNGPTALACDAADNILVWDSYNGRIRRVDQLQNVTTMTGNGNNYSPADGVGTNTSFANLDSSWQCDRLGG